MDAMTEAEMDALIAQHEAEKAERAAAMPTDQDAINALFSVYQRLKELGWRDAIYCPKDGSWFDVIEVGSTGIHRCQYTGVWPTGHWWVTDADDLWPSYPCMFRPVSPAPEAAALLDELAKAVGV